MIYVKTSINDILTMVIAYEVCFTVSGEGVHSGKQHTWPFKFGCGARRMVALFSAFDDQLKSALGHYTYVVTQYEYTVTYETRCVLRTKPDHCFNFFCATT